MSKVDGSVLGAEGKRALWGKRIAQWERSGQTQRAYCAAHSIALSSFQWWRARLNRLEVSRSMFVPLSLSTQPSVAANVIEVELRSGTRVRFEGEAATVAVDRLLAKVR